MNRFDQLSAAREKKVRKHLNVSYRTAVARLKLKRQGQIKVKTNDAMHHVRQKCSTNKQIQQLKNALRSERIKNTKLAAANAKLNQSLQSWNDNPLQYLKNKTIYLIKQYTTHLRSIRVDKYDVFSCCYIMLYHALHILF